MQTVEINSYSDTLSAIVEKARPTEGVSSFRILAKPKPIDAADSEGRRFNIDRLPARIRMKLKERIIDPGTKKFVTIANLIGYEEGGAVGQREKPIIEEVVFLGTSNGQIDVPFDNPVLFERLLLSNYNKDNPNPSATEPETGYLFGLVQPARDAETKLTSALDIARALVAIDELSDAGVLRAVEKLSLPTVDRGRTLALAELKLSLTTVAQSDPARVTSVLEAGENKLDTLVEAAVKLELLDFVAEAQEWRWKATQQPITVAVQGYKPEQALVMYIQNNANGPGFSQTLARAVEGKQAAEKKAKGRRGA